MKICKICGHEALNNHVEQYHKILTEYNKTSSYEAKTRAELNKEIKKLAAFINISSFENPMNMGPDKEKLEGLKNELASLGEAEMTDEERDTANDINKNAADGGKYDRLKEPWEKEREGESRRKAREDNLVKAFKYANHMDDDDDMDDWNSLGASLSKLSKKEQEDMGVVMIPDFSKESRHRASENMEDLEISGYNFTGPNDSQISCVDCGKTFNVGSYPRTNIDQVEREAQNHSATHQDLDELFNISGLSGSSDGSCKRCGAIPENGDYKGHLRTHGIGESKKKAREFQVMCPKCSMTYDTFAKGGKCEYCGADNREFYGGESKRRANEFSKEDAGKSFNTLSDEKKAEIIGSTAFAGKDAVFSNLYDEEKEKVYQYYDISNESRRKANEMPYVSHTQYGTDEDADVSEATWKCPDCGKEITELYGGPGRGAETPESHLENEHGYTKDDAEAKSYDDHWTYWNESYASEEEVPTSMSEEDRARLELRNQDAEPWDEEKHGKIEDYAEEGIGTTWGRDEANLWPEHTDETQCVTCGLDIDNHANPNTDYRGMNGTAPPTDHYFQGGDMGGSDDKLYFENKALEGVDDLTTDDLFVMGIIDRGQVPLGTDDNISNKLVRTGHAEDIGDNSFGQRQIVITDQGKDFMGNSFEAMQFSDTDEETVKTWSERNYHKKWDSMTDEEQAIQTDQYRDRNRILDVTSADESIQSPQEVLEQFIDQASPSGSGDWYNWQSYASSRGLTTQEIDEQWDEWGLDSLQHNDDMDNVRTIVSGFKSPQLRIDYSHLLGEAYTYDEIKADLDSQTKEERRITKEIFDTLGYDSLDQDGKTSLDILRKEFGGELLGSDGWHECICGKQFSGLDEFRNHVEENHKDMWDSWKSNEGDVLIDDSGPELDWLNKYGTAYTDGNQTIVDTDNEEKLGNVLEQEQMVYRPNKEEWGWSEEKAPAVERAPWVEDTIDYYFNIGDSAGLFVELRANGVTDDEIKAIEDEYRISEAGESTDENTCQECGDKFNDKAEWEDHKLAHGESK